MKRLRAALRTNEVQVSSVISLTLLNLAVCVLVHTETPPGFWLAATLFWPSIALLSNLIDPIPKEENSDGG